MLDGGDRKVCLVGVDLGTTGLKCLGFDTSGRVLCKAYREYPLHHPAPNATEQGPQDWWRALCATLRELVDRGGIDPRNVAGLSLSSQGSTLVLLGDDGAPLRPAISWLDLRAADLLDPGGSGEEELFAITGLRAFPGWTGSILRWLAADDSETLRRARHVLVAGDYLIFRLTGVVKTEYSSASRTRMLDLEKKEWSAPIVAGLGIRDEQLPALGQSGEVAGVVSAEAAAATGLLSGTPVVLGGFDQSCTALGAGVIAEGVAVISLGTATMVNVASAQPTVDPERRVTTSCHAIPNTWTLQAPIMTTGALLRWWRDHFFPRDQADVYAAMDRCAEQAPIGADGLMVFPHFSGSGAPHWDARYRGAMVGLTLSHTQAHVIRAMLEGVAIEIRANLDVMQELGHDVAVVRIVGGGAASMLWRGIIGDVLSKPQERVNEVEAGALGAAMLAGLGAGVFADPAEAVREMVSLGPRTDYSPGKHAAYEAVRRRYWDVFNRLYGKP